MGRAELLALVIKVLELIAPIALSLLAGTAPDACARARPLDLDQLSVQTEASK